MPPKSPKATAVTTSDRKLESERSLVEKRKPQSIILQHQQINIPLPEMSDVERMSSSSSQQEEHLLDRKSSSRGSLRNPAQQGQVALSTMLQSWVSRKFAVGCAILFPVVVTVYITWWFLQFFDSIFSPIYELLFSFHVFGLGFVTSMAFILGTGVFFSSWLGTALLSIGELLIRRLPLIKHIYSSAKQVSAALNPENEAAKAFQECCLIRHPRQGEWAFGFVTGKTEVQTPQGPPLRLLSVYVPTNHVYIGDVFLMEEKDVIHTNLSVREGLEIVVSVGMTVPPSLTTSRSIS
ncbi:hypothetical protein CEUSTIGMA_g3353.t1 [Chlamydomonas eustigma]|uniref:Uncharacterized protein n=1 Tax=Chlamydomonas eustigma TaxID=1157962 RepID=A0A250WZH6_9CHLO|nr:hypothetical protein CEUSTIGMA_g3353.t1 [Chlamydomonas eustigma]|eukprot:GAX75910.1 hypothetical protein CEUSTIGMA_g3353.t1 [Chlamydomonas eustigma]